MTWDYVARVCPVSLSVSFIFLTPAGSAVLLLSQTLAQVVGFKWRDLPPWFPQREGHLPTVTRPIIVSSTERMLITRLNATGRWLTCALRHSIHIQKVIKTVHWFPHALNMCYKNIIICVKTQIHKYKQLNYKCIYVSGLWNKQTFIYYFTYFTFSHLADVFIQSDLQIRKSY